MLVSDRCLARQALSSSLPSRTRSRRSFRMYIGTGQAHSHCGCLVGQPVDDRPGGRGGNPSPDHVAWLLSRSYHTHKSSHDLQPHTCRRAGDLGTGSAAVSSGAQKRHRAVIPARPVWQTNEVAPPRRQAQSHPARAARRRVQRSPIATGRPCRGWGRKAVAGGRVSSQHPQLCTRTTALVSSDS